MIQRPLVTWTEYKRWTTDDDLEINELKAELRQILDRPSAYEFCEKLLQLLTYLRVQEVNYLANDSTRKNRTFIDGIKEIEQQLNLLKTNKERKYYAR